MALQEVWAGDGTTQADELAEAMQMLVEGVHLAGKPVGGVHPSDHLAVVADLRWRG